jgi:Tol biopolymer transport system component
LRSFLEIYDLATGTSRQVLDYDGVIEAPNWDPSGASLLINGGGRLYRVPLEAPELIPVDTGFATRCNNDHGISPDGATVVISNHRERGSEIFLLPAGGGEPKLISPDAPSWWHGWSPDGQRLAYVAARRSRIIDVYTISVAGGRETRLTIPPTGATSTTTVTATVTRRSG